jgi:hypothetical protein
MEKIAFKDWRLIAAAEDADGLKLEIEALDGSDILLMTQPAQAGGCDGEPYMLKFSSQKIESAHEGAPHGRTANLGEEGDDGGAWGADEDETIYLRGWEVTALVDEEGLLNVEVQKGDEADIFAVETLEPGAPLSPHVSVRLAAEVSADDEDEDEGNDDFDDDYERSSRHDLDDDMDELDELDEGDDYEEEDNTDENDSFSPYDDLFERDEDDWY